MKKRKIITAALAMTLSAATATTGIVSNPQVYVQAAENTTVKKLADSSVSGFFYQYDKYGDVQCTTDKTYVYTSYDEAVKDIGTMAKKIYLEDKYDKFSLKIPMEIKTGEKVDKIENNQFDKDIQKVIREDTGKADEGYTLVFMQRCGGEVYSEDGDSFRSSYTNGTYKGYYGGIGGYRDMSDRYHQTVKKINTVIESLNLDGKSDYDKFKAITNWIVSNVKYDSHYNGEPNTPAGTKYPHDMTGAVLDGYAVCDGYAGLFYYMANAVGIKALYEDGTSISEQRGHAWNLLEMDNAYYYVDPTNAYFKEDGEPGSEVLYGQKYFFSLYRPDSTTIEDTYKNISQDDWLKEHSICKGNHNLRENGGKSAQCTTPATIHYECTNPGCLYEYDVESSPALGHAWDEGRITQEQSCDNPEITTYTCTRSNCRKKKQVETKPALGHTWDEGKITKEATCTEKGVKTYTCSRCGETKTEEIPLLKHDYEEQIVKPATCISTGIANYVCKNCGQKIQKKLPITDHTRVVKNRKEATCGAAGYTGDVYCSVCNKKLESGKTIPKLSEHTWGEWTITNQPTCKKYGVKQRRCKVCNELDIETIAKTDHKWILESTTPATCGIGEIQHYKCSVCGKTKDVTLSNPLGEHSWDNGKVTKEATCTKDGEKTYTCTVCNTTKTEAIPATGHQHKEVRNAKKATCTEDGYTGDTYCTDCNTKLESGTVINKLGHTWDNGVITKEATETEEGVKTYTCKTCGETKTESIPMAYHHWDQGTVTKEPTCTEKGEKTHHCTDEGCDKTWIETIPATGHQHTEIRDKKEATCEENGYSGDTYCKDCGQLISKGSEIKAKGHTWDNGKVTEEATCKKEGIKTYTCSICGDTKTEAIPKKEHSFDEGKVTKKATCTEDGLKVYTCKNCGETKEEILKATGHQHTEVRNEKKATCKEKGYSGDIYCADCGELVKKGSATEKADHTWKLTKEQNATCEADGSKTYTCEVCGETKTETIKATGHQFSAWKTIQEQSVFSDGVQERTCSICGKKETRNTGEKLKATITTNASSLKLKRRQSTKKFVVSGLAKGDSVKSWASSNKKIVSVSGKTNGTCTIKAGNKTGKAKITITLVSGLKKVINVTVQKKAVTCTSIKNVPKKITLNTKKSYQLKPVINPITCTDKIKYKTSNKKIVKVTSRGKITTVKKGKAKVTIIVGKRKFVCAATVK
ncbi:hypothetical protein G4945_12275 [Anaerostipes hadrus]|uniref:Ig-like domain-containing protein n=1 Tax=Anaerostipes hadrus TaxID=649756 RepID=UPI00156EE9D5|nr:Ig-like domain-containing protein [Anaerostipes hadrus]NSH56013.1 hypothetical protein [Anaerostipes hadrus]